MERKCYTINHIRENKEILVYKTYARISIGSYRISTMIQVSNQLDN